MARPLSLLLILLALVAGLAACGDDGDGGSSPGTSADAATLLRQTKDHAVKKASVDAVVKLKLDGIAQLSDVEFAVRGPVENRGAKQLPLFDFDITFIGGPLTLRAKAVATQDNLFVTYQDQAYEVGKAQTAKLTKELFSGDKQAFSDFGIDPTTWFKDPKKDGEREIDGEKMTRVRGAIDVRKVVQDVVKINNETPETFGQKPVKVTDAQIDEIVAAVKTADAEVFIAEDGSLRGFATTVAFAVPAAQREAAGGLRGGTLTADLTLTKVGDAVTVAAPADPKPIEDLVRAFAGSFGRPQ